MEHPSGSDIPSGSTATRSKKRLTAFIVVPAAAAVLVWGSISAVGAFFTAQAEVAGQSVGIATIAIDAATAGGSTPISVPAMLPGDSAVTEVAITNTGTGGVYYSIALPATGTGDASLEDALQVTVAVDGVTHTASLSNWQGGALHFADALVAGGTRTATVTVALPSSVTDNNLQGTTTGFGVQVNAIQEANTTAPTTGFTN